jgi:DNA-directed RNA polymerase specialized sigma24 family protein
MASRRPLSPTKRTFIAHARQTQVAERLKESTLAGIRNYSNPVIRLEASHAILMSEDQIRAERREAVNELYASGWTWEQIGSLIGVSKQRAWQIGNGQ